MQQLGGGREPDGVWADEIAPDPMVMAPDADSVEVRAVAQSMGIGHHDDVVVVRDRRTHGGIDAQIGGPAGHQHAIRRDPAEARLQLGAAKGSFMLF